MIRYKPILITLILLLIFCSCKKNETENLNGQIKTLKLKNDSLRNIFSKSIVIPITATSMNNLAPFILSPRANYMINDTIPLIGGIGIINIDDIALNVKINDSIKINSNKQMWSYKYIPKKIGYDTLNGEYTIQKGNKKVVLKFRQIFLIHKSREQLLEHIK